MGRTLSSQMRQISALLAAGMLAGCGGLRVPDPVPYTAGCPTGPVRAASEDQSQFFFLSSALPDCRDGSLKLAPFRHYNLTYGSGLYNWADERKPLEPAMVAHARETWMDGIARRLAEPASKGRLLIFIHGYNTTFIEAHETAAKIGKLAGKDVPLVLFHWPSRERALSYPADEATISWAQGPIDEALADLTAKADDITIVGHSMGVRATIRAVLALDGYAHARPERVRKVVLASGDEDRDRVLREGGSVDMMLRHDRQILIYSSYRDTPIDLSRRVHAYARLGSTDCSYDLIYSRRALGKHGNCHRTFPREGLSVVSTSRIDPADHYDHNDFIEDCRTRADFSAFLRGAPPPPFRVDISEGELAGFEIVPDGPDPDGLCPPDE
ncbi:MAG: alpha/beta fold hydrolase [Erythrobacter sp.]|nr:alpha/beta fold hydrolase [Erythrobacter sp.]